MIPVDQTNTSSTNGDCLTASVASLLELSIEEVPHFSAMPGSTWWTELFAFVNRNVGPDEYLTKRPYTFPVYGDDVILPDRGWRHVIGCGPSPRGDWDHAVILDAKTGELVHDPHPTDKRGIGPGYVLAVVTEGDE